MEVRRKNNRHLGLIIFIAFLLIAAGIIAYVVINYNNDQALVKKRMEEVESGYQTFKDDADNFNDIRDNIYNAVMQDMYYQMLKDNDEFYKSLFLEYEEALDKVDQDYQKIKDNCINVLYPDVSTNNKCEALISGYEEMVNIYVSDVTSYNNSLTSYNNWLKEKESTDSPLKLVSTDYQYIDVNGDREYDGKSEEKTELTDQTLEGEDSSSE